MRSSSGIATSQVPLKPAPACDIRVPSLRRSAAKGGVAAAVAHDLARLLAFDVPVDAGHPRIDLVHQQSLAQRLDVVGPLDDAGGGDLDPGQAPLAGKAAQAGHPVDTV